MVRNYVRLTQYMTVNPDHVESAQVIGPDLPKEARSLELRFVSGHVVRVAVTSLYAPTTLTLFIS